MKRIYVICEGTTEETFINEFLKKELHHYEVDLIATRIGKPGHQGGYVNYYRALQDIKELLKHKGAYCTTFFDFYGIDPDFPGKYAALQHHSTLMGKQDIIHQGFIDKLRQDLVGFDLSRFIPYIQMYEFEGLLFSKPEILAQTIGNNDTFTAIRGEFETPEHINNSTITAPSKRILRVYPSYEKVLHGNIVALDIGLAVMRQECPLFNKWVSILESLSQKN